MLAVLLTATPALATTRFVDNALVSDCTSGNYSIAAKNCTGSAGNAYNTLAEGLALTVSGDTLWVRSGASYTTTITSSSYTTGGTSWANAPVIGGCSAAVCGSDEYPVINTTASQIVNLTNAANKYTILTRIVFDGVNQASADPNAQWLRWTADHIRLDDVEVKNVKFHGVACITGADGSEVLNSRLHDIGNYVAGDNLGNALYWSCDFGLIEGNEFYANDYASVWFNPGSDNIFRRNISHNQRNWVNFSGSRNLVYNNLVYGMTGIAASISYDCAPHAAPCSYGNKLFNNTIYSQPSIGIEIGSFFGADSNEVKNNAIVCTTTAVVPVKIYGADDDNNVLSYNRWEGCAAVADSGTGTVNTNNTTGASGFTNAAGNDFTLTSGSTLRDAGTDLSAILTTDYIGTARPQNGTFDIGAYEYLISIGGGGSTGNLGKGSKGLMGGM